MYKDILQDLTIKNNGDESLIDEILSFKDVAESEKLTKHIMNLCKLSATDGGVATIVKVEKEKISSDYPVLVFKRSIRCLKAGGLTVSHKGGYEILVAWQD